jgi:predicted ester cyclase
MSDNQDMMNKDLVRKFNSELISAGNRAVFFDIIGRDFIDHTAPPANSGADALSYFIFDMLRVAIPDIKVEIEDLIGEGEKVTTRKVFRGIFAGDLLGLTATHRPIAIDVIDIFTVRDGRLVEHWGMNNFAQAAAGIAVPAATDR